MNFIFICLISLSECYKGFETEDLLGPHCRDDQNKPVAWWYIYKPPEGVLYGQHRYSFISPDTDGRWIPSLSSITEADMLINTLVSNYKRSYKNRAGRASVIFESRVGTSRSSARGVAMAGQEGGFLLTHTIPGFPGKMKSRPFFPLKELENGHLLSCLSLDLTALNKVARAIKEIIPNITFSYTPETITDLLPKWNFDQTLPHPAPFRLRPTIYSLIRVNKSILNNENLPLDNPFYNSIAGPIELLLVARPPGVKNCIYSSFAARQLVMLNVYGRSRSSYLTTTCSVGFGVRNIDSLCLKHEGPEGPGSGHTYYVPTNSSDATWFAVSTAAHWQQQGTGARQFWVCTSLVDKEDVTGEGGWLLCVQNYAVWVAFDNLKVSEPSCD